MVETTREFRSSQVHEPDHLQSFFFGALISKKCTTKRKHIQRQYDQVDAERLELGKKNVQILLEILAIDRQFIQNDTNADYNFLMSLLPFIEPLTLIEKLGLRKKLLLHPTILFLFLLNATN